MKHLLLSLVILPMLLAGCGKNDPTFTDVRQFAGGKSVCITLSHNCSENKWWRYAADTPGILREGSTADVFGEVTAGPDGTTEIPESPAPGNQYIVFHGAAPGTTRVMLSYADHERGAPAETVIVYRITVRPDLTVDMEELSRTESACDKQEG